MELQPSHAPGVVEDAVAWARTELVRLIEIPSTSGDETEIIAYLERRARELGLPVRRHPVAADRDNLVIGCQRAPEIAVIAHVDTVDPTGRRPLRARVRGNQVWGIGASDDKGAVVAALLAMVLAKQAGAWPAELPFAVGLTVDEEQDGSGSAALADSLHPRRVVVLEATGMDVAIAAAGSVEASVRVRGRSAHGSLPETGDNAVVKAARLVVALEGLLPAAADALLVQQFHGGSELHVVPDVAEIQLDARVGPGGDPQAVLSSLRALVAGYDGELEVIEIVTPWSTPADSPFVAAVARAVADETGRQPRLIGFPAWTDAHNMVEICAAEAVVLGPGPLLRHAHRQDDRIDVREVVACAGVLRRLIVAAG